MKLFHLEYVDARIRKQINNYIEEYHFTYSGIRKVPYVYKDAYNYYLSLWEANQKNEDKDVEQFVPQVVKIKIPRPQRKIKKRKCFEFLDEESEE